MITVEQKYGHTRIVLHSYPSSSYAKTRLLGKDRCKPVFKHVYMYIYIYIYVYIYICIYIYIYTYIHISIPLYI
jgi:hypothetical protein